MGRVRDIRAGGTRRQARRCGSQRHPRANQHRRRLRNQAIAPSEPSAHARHCGARQRRRVDSTLRCALPPGPRLRVKRGWRSPGRCTLRDRGRDKSSSKPEKERVTKEVEGELLRCDRRGGA
jgi:hypothetical protein